MLRFLGLLDEICLSEEVGLFEETGVFEGDYADLSGFNIYAIFYYVVDPSISAY